MDLTLPALISALTGPFAATLLLAALVAAVAWWIDRRAWPLVVSWTERHLVVVENQGREIVAIGRRLDDLIRVHETATQALSAGITDLREDVDHLADDLRSVHGEIQGLRAPASPPSQG